MTLKRVDHIGKSALGAAFLALALYQACAGFGYEPQFWVDLVLSGSAGATGAIIGWRQSRRFVIDETPPFIAKLREAAENYNAWSEDQLRQAVEPHAIRLGIRVDVLMATYSEIQAEMKEVGAA